MYHPNKTKNNIYNIQASSFRMLSLYLIKPWRRDRKEIQPRERDTNNQTRREITRKTKTHNEEQMSRWKGNNDNRQHADTRTGHTHTDRLRKNREKKREQKRKDRPSIPMVYRWRS